RFSHEYQCTRCSKTFPLPVELDRSRPIYCEDCMPIIQEEKKSGKKSGPRDTRGGSRDTRGPSRDRKDKRPEQKPVPKVSEGEILEKKIDDKEVSLSALTQTEPKEKKEIMQKEAPAPKPQKQEKPVVTMQDVAKHEANQERLPKEQKPKQETSEQTDQKRNRRRRKRKPKNQHSTGNKLVFENDRQPSNKVEPPPAKPVEEKQPNKLDPGKIVSFND
ncbi:MAG: hypothetical protein ABH846_03765, partial [Patescibacteria group bacterium]